MLLLARCATGEDWNMLMHDCAVQLPRCTPHEREVEGYWLPDDCGSPALAVLYFVSFYVVGVLVILNLFVTVIIDNFTFVMKASFATILG